MVVDCGAEEVRERIEPVRKWFGDYNIMTDGDTQGERLTPSVGMVSWRPGRGYAAEFSPAPTPVMGTRKKAQRGKAKQIAATKNGSICRPAGTFDRKWQLYAL